MPAHPKFRELLEEEFKEHDSKTTQYNRNNGSLANWNLVVPVMRPWQGAYARLTEKIARLFSLAESAKREPEKFREILREISVYCKIVRILFDEDLILKVEESIDFTRKNK